ncbi:MAG: TRAP transporter small permease [Variovorax sp.]
MSSASRPASQGSSAIAWFDRGLAIFAGTLVVALLGAVSAGIVFRAANHPLSWTDEASGMLMVWLSCAGWMIGTRRGAHIRIRFFQDKLPRQAWRGTEVTILLAMALLGGTIAWYSVYLIRANADIESIALPLSNAWLYVPLLPAGLMTLVQALADLWQPLAGSAPQRGGAAP